MRAAAPTPYTKDQLTLLRHARPKRIGHFVTVPKGGPCFCNVGVGYNVSYSADNENVFVDGEVKQGVTR